MGICYLLDGEMPPARQNGKSLPCVRLQAENDSLRKELAVTNPLFATLNAANDGLISENAKLRELVADLYQCSRQVGCDHCGDGYRRSCNVLNRMRELGVEVDG